MRIPRAFGIWTHGEEDSNQETILMDKLAKIDGKAVYCPFCKKRMHMWMEGCTLWHIYCKRGEFHLIVKTKKLRLKKLKTFEKLVDIIYE